jgi:uncharacterized protein with HEPN domain
MSEHRDEKHYLNDILESIAAIEIYLENVNYNALWPTHFALRFTL